MNINSLMQQAQKMQKEMEKKQKQIDEKIFDIVSAGGGISISIRGDKTILKLNIDESLIDKNDKQLLEDMVMTAVNEAISTVNAEVEKVMSSAAGGMRIPGMF